MGSWTGTSLLCLDQQVQHSAYNTKQSDRNLSSTQRHVNLNMAKWQQSANFVVNAKWQQSANFIMKARFTVNAVLV